MKKHHLLKAIYIIIIIFTLCSCKLAEEPDNYGITVDFFMHPGGNGKYDGWRFIYDKEKNTAIASTSKNIKLGARNTSYLDSAYSEQILALKESRQLGQFNDYRCFGDTELALFWNWGADQKNTLIFIQNGSPELIEISRGDDVAFLYFDENKNTVYLKSYITWKEDSAEYSGSVFAVDLTAKKVTEHNICVYNDQLAKQYNIDSQRQHPFSEWDFFTNPAALCVIPDNDCLALCVTFAPLIPETKTIIATNLLIKYDLTSKSIVNLKVADEAICHFQKTDYGYLTFSQDINRTGIAATSFVQRIWMSRYDKDFNLIDTAEINCDKFKDCNNVLVYGQKNDVFMVGSNMKKNSNILAHYDILSGKLEYSKYMPDGLIADCRLIQKIDGKIINLQS